MKQVSGKRLAKLAESTGWSLARVNRSHHLYVMGGSRERVVIPIHGNRSTEDRAAEIAHEDDPIGRLRATAHLTSGCSQRLTPRSLVLLGRTHGFEQA